MKEVLIVSLLFTLFIASQTENTEKELPADSNKCSLQISKVRERFNSLKGNRKKKFASKLIIRLRNKYPTVAESEVKKFVSVLLLTPLPTERVCETFRYMFRDRKGLEFDL